MVVPDVEMIGRLVDRMTPQEAAISFWTTVTLTGFVALYVCSEIYDNFAARRRERKSTDHYPTHEQTK